MTLRNYIQSLAANNVNNKDILFFYGKEKSDHVMILIRNGDTSLTQKSLLQKYLDDEILVTENLNSKSCHVYIKPAS